MRALMFGLAVAGIALLPASSAHACSKAYCDTAVFPATGALPANMVRLRFSRAYPRSDQGTPATPRLYRLEGTTQVSIAYDSEPIDERTSWIEPRDAQAAGTTLVLEYDDPTGCTFAPKQFTVTDAKPLPTALGTLGATPARGEIAVASGESCSETLLAGYADLQVQLSPEAEPYAAVLDYQLFIDGARRDSFRSNTATNQRLPQGEDRIFRRCEVARGEQRWANELTAGAHRVHFEATLPDGTKLSTPDIDVEVSCESAPPGDAALTQIVEGDDDGCSVGNRNPSWLLLVLALLGVRGWRSASSGSRVRAAHRRSRPSAQR